MGSFYFSSSESYFLKYKEFFRGVRFLKYKKSFHFRKYKKSFRGFSFLKHKTSFNIRVRKFHFPPEYKFSQSGFFHFWSLGWKVQGSISRNIKKAFFWENIINILILELESFISRNIRNFFGSGFFFVFSSLDWKVHQIAA